MTTTDATTGIVFLEETDPITPFHTLINGLQTATSNSLKSTRKGYLYAANNTDRDAYLTTYGSSATAPLWVDVAGVIQRHDGTGWAVMDRTAFPFGQWTLGGAVAVSSGVFTVAPIATAVGTPDTGFTNSSGAITIARTGTYQLSATTVWNGTGGNRRAIIPTINSAAIDGGGNVSGGGRTVGSQVSAPAGSSPDYTFSVTFPPFTATAGDILRVFVFHDAGVPISLNPGSATTYLGQTRLALWQIAG
jgi:hypothetical protein